MRRRIHHAATARHARGRTRAGSLAWALALAALAALAAGATADRVRADEPLGSQFTGKLVSAPATLVPRTPVACTGSETVLLIQDVVPWFAPGDPGDDPEGAVATELQLQGSNYCQISAADIGTTSLGGFRQIVISSAQTQAFYDGLFPGGTIHPSLDAWVQSGGILAANLADNASGPGNSGTWAGDTFIAGVQQVSSGNNDNGIAAPGHPIVASGPPCPSGHCAPLVDTAQHLDLDGWGSSTHGYFVNLPPGTTVILDMPDVTGDSIREPIAIEYPHGAGRVLAFMTTTEFRYAGGFGSTPRSRSLLANELAYQASITDPPLGHFTCYRAKAAKGAPKFTPVAGVTLVDQFGSSVVDVKKPVALCNPTDKNGEDPHAPSRTDHLESYQIKAPAGSPKFVPVVTQKVVNQFGTIFVDALKPERLLVPTAKSLSGPTPPLTPPTIDHFQCYRARVRGLPRFTAIPNVTLVDQFGTALVDVKKPTRLCNPADKNGEDPSAPGHLDHLMCYQVKPVKGAPKFTKVTPIYVTNQFGSEILEAVKRDEICVPSAKNPACGNGVTETLAGEECDDGNAASGDGCSSSCQAEFCGDGATQAGIGEQCDDGNAASGDGCSATCQTEFCGDGATQAGLGEQCDDGNATSGDGCSSTCQTEFCGDGVVQSGIGEQCDGADDAACPGACEAAICLCGPLPFSPVTEDLTTCNPRVTDTWVFTAVLGESVVVNADTVDAPTAADLCFSGSCVGGQTFAADDNTSCTFPPPGFSCPTSTFTASGSGLCTVNVTLCSSSCANPATANYRLRITRNGADTQVGLTGDDQ